MSTQVVDAFHALTPGVGDWSSVVPELGLALVAVYLLFAEALRGSSPVARTRLGASPFFVLFLVIVLRQAYIMPANASLSFFSGMVEHTRSVELLRAFFLVCGLLTCQIGAVVMPKYKLPRVEFDVLVLIATSGLMFLAQCRNFVLLFVALEVMSVSMYVLVAYMRHSSESLEAGLKYLVQSGISSAFLLMGIVLLYGAAGNAAFPGATDDPFDFIQLRTFVALNVGNLYVVSGVGMVLVGLLFKVAAVPFQMWVCDVYQGAPTPVTAYLGVASKAAGFVLLFSVLGGPFSPLCEGLLPLMVVVAVATVLFGNFAALGQRNVKRLMGLSGISHAGYMLMGVCAFMGGVEWAPTAVFFYLLVYLLSSFAVFSVIGCVCGEDDSSQSLDDYAGLARRDPFLASVMVVALSSLAGIPPMAGFVAKVLLFIAAFKAGLFVLAGFALLGVVVSIYYYFGWIRQIVFVPCSGEVEARSGVPTLGVGFWMRTMLMTLSILTICLGFWQGFLSL
jgi:NADH-quinone oxidoreductase subunit N